MSDRARHRSPRRPARPRGGARRAGWSGSPARVFDDPADQADIDGAADRLRAGLRCCAEPVFQISRDGKVRRCDDSGCVLQDLVARQCSRGIPATDRDGVPRARRAERFKPQGGQDPRRAFIPGIGEDERPGPLVQGPESLVRFTLRCHHASCPSCSAARMPGPLQTRRDRGQGVSAMRGVVERRKQRCGPEQRCATPKNGPYSDT